ncbi:MAG: DUF3995 domain-containing protein [Acidimicrobiales bacterium]
MSIRRRREIGSAVSGSVAAIVLAGGAIVHGLWARGSTWPVASREELADLVVGRRPMPGPLACATVSTALAGAAAVTAHSSMTGRSKPGRWTRAAATAVSGVLLVRGIGGAVVDAGNVAPEFRRWNRRLFSPLCVVLGLLVAAGRRSRP